MTLKYQDLPPERMQSNLRYYKSVLKEMQRISSRYTIGSIDHANWMKEIVGVEKNIEIIENLLKPKIDYEDGTWV
jgi:hypothetical protein